MSRETVFSPLKIIFVLCLFVLVIGCTATGFSVQGTPLPFETIDQVSFADTGDFYESKAPGFVMLTSASEIGQLGGSISTGAKEQLLNLNYTNEWAIVLFLGTQATVHEGITIDRIAYEDNLINVVAQSGKRTGQHAITSPYHIVKIKKPEFWNVGDSLQITVNIDREVVISQTKTIADYTFLQALELPTVTYVPPTPWPTKTLKAP